MCGVGGPAVLQPCQDRGKMIQDRLKMTQHKLKMAQDMLKMSKDRPKDEPRQTQDSFFSERRTKKVYWNPLKHWKCILKRYTEKVY